MRKPNASGKVTRLTVSLHFPVDIRRPERYIGMRAITDVDGFPVPVTITGARIAVDSCPRGVSTGKYPEAAAKLGKYVDSNVVFGAVLDRTRLRKEYRVLVGLGPKERRVYTDLTPDKLWHSMESYIKHQWANIEKYRQDLLDYDKKNEIKTPPALYNSTVDMFKLFEQRMFVWAQAISQKDWETAAHAAALLDRYSGEQGRFHDEFERKLFSIDTANSQCDVLGMARKQALVKLADRLDARSKHRIEHTKAWSDVKLTYGRDWLLGLSFYVTKLNGEHKDVFALDLTAGRVVVSLPDMGVWRVRYVAWLNDTCVMQAKGRQLYNVLDSLCRKHIGDRDVFNKRWKSVFGGKPSECYGADMEKLLSIIEKDPAAWRPVYKPNKKEQA